MDTSGFFIVTVGAIASFVAGILSNWLFAKVAKRSLASTKTVPIKNAKILSEAKNSLSIGEKDTAVILAFAALENALRRQVLSNTTPYSFRDLLEEAYKTQLLTAIQYNNLMKLYEARNKAVHGIENSESVAEDVLEQVGSVLSELKVVR